MTQVVCVPGIVAQGSVPSIPDGPVPSDVGQPPFISSIADFSKTFQSPAEPGVSSEANFILPVPLYIDQYQPYGFSVDGIGSTVVRPSRFSVSFQTDATILSIALIGGPNNLLLAPEGGGLTGNTTFTSHNPSIEYSADSLHGFCIVVWVHFLGPQRIKFVWASVEYETTLQTPVLYAYPPGGTISPGP